MMRPLYLLISIIISVMISCNDTPKEDSINTMHSFNGSYKGKFLEKVAFPIGGIGAGMVCLEGAGAISHVSVYNKPDIFNEPNMFAAISIKGLGNGAKILQGPVPEFKKFGRLRTGRGIPGSNYGFPRFENAEFEARFPFGRIKLSDDDIPLNVTITGWSPFIPLDPDNSSLPCGVLEYTFKNSCENEVSAVFSFSSVNFMKKPGCVASIKPISNGFVLSNQASEDAKHIQGDFAFFTDDSITLVDHCWFRGYRLPYDGLNYTWKQIENAGHRVAEPIEQDAPGASLYVPFSLKPGEEKKVKLLFAWYVPHSDLRYGKDLPNETVNAENNYSYYYRPWYSSRFKSVKEVAEYWLSYYHDLKTRSEKFTEAFYNTTLPDVVVEAIAANLTILKSPTVLRDFEGRLWNYEGCDDDKGLGHANAHVWNYAQAIPHLFPSLERSMRETEFFASQDEQGHQAFNSGLPVRKIEHEFYAAADGQLGGIMKAYRDWRISGDDTWLNKMYPHIKKSIDFCIKEWDPCETGTLEEPQHNTFDTRFWGPNGMNTSCYHGALKAFIFIGEYLGKEVSYYQTLLDKGKTILENDLFNSEYFIQKIQWEGLKTPSPMKVYDEILNFSYSDEARELCSKEGPLHQYGNGCLSNGIMGTWMAKVCGIDQEIIDEQKVKSHMEAVYKYNFKTSLNEHVNPGRPGYALGQDGGLLNCTWPDGTELLLPFVYSGEVWTGIEYQVASQMMFLGENDKALDIVKVCRKRYDGSIRNPFDEYEWGHWYGRAMASYAMLQALTGIRYDAVTKTLYIDSRVGDGFNSFFACQTGFGNIGLENGKPYVKMAAGFIDVKKCFISETEYPITERNIFQ